MLDNLYTKKIELHTNSKDISKIKLPSLLPSVQNSHLLTWTLLVLNIFYFILIIVFVSFQALSYWELNLVAPISSLAIHKIFFLLASNTDSNFEICSQCQKSFWHKTISEILVQLSKKTPCFCLLEVILKWIASMASYYYG